MFGTRALAGVVVAAVLVLAVPCQAQDRNGRTSSSQRDETRVPIRGLFVIGGFLASVFFGSQKKS